MIQEDSTSVIYGDRNQIYSIGIDVGLDGAIAIIDGHYNMIKMAKPPKRGEKRIDNLEFLRLLRTFIPQKYSHVFITVEDVHALFISGKVQTFELGRNADIADFAARIVASEFNNTSYHCIQPKEWQKEAWSNADKSSETLKKGQNKHDAKKVSMCAAKRLWPKVKWLAKMNGEFDASLMAYSTLRQHIRNSGIDMDTPFNA